MPATLDPGRIRAWLGKLRVKLLLAFLLVTLVPFALIVWLNNSAARQALTDAAYRSLSAAARHTAAELDEFTTETETTLGAESKQPQLASFLSSRAGSPPRRRAEDEVREILRSFLHKDRTFIASYALLDLSGRNVIDTWKEQEEKDESQDACFQGALETNLPFAAPLRFSPVDGNPYLCFSTPVPDARGAVLGVLRLLYSAAVLQQLVLAENDLLGPPSFAILLDENGVILAQGASSPGGAAALLYRLVAPLSPERIAALTAGHRLPRGGPPGVVPIPALAPGAMGAGDADRYFRSAPIGEARGDQVGTTTAVRSWPWTVAYLQTEEVFLGPVAVHTRRMLALAAAIGALVALVAVWVAQVLAKPIAGLTAFVRRVTAGDLRGSADVMAGGEMGALVDAFNAMTVRLRERDEDLARARGLLEQRVEQRTRELSDANARLLAEMAERERAEAEREALGKQLLETAHRAGMSEIAASVLHNVGNVLNSLNVSASLLADRLPGATTERLRRVVEILRAHEGDLLRFATEDARGAQIVDYLAALADALAGEQADLAAEVENICSDVEHIKAIMAMQQAYAGAGGAFVSTVDLRQLVEDALRMTQLDLSRHGVEVVRELGDVPAMRGEKHKVLSILVNLLTNAIAAIARQRGAPRRLTVRLSLLPAEDRVRIEVADTGVGIEAQNLARVFQRGYTTEENGQGLGLHSAAVAAAEMRGSLTAASEGPEKGAVFTLELPLHAAAGKDAPLSSEAV